MMAEKESIHLQLQRSEMVGYYLTLLPGVLPDLSSSRYVDVVVVVAAAPDLFEAEMISPPPYHLLAPPQQAAVSPWSSYAWRPLPPPPQSYSSAAGLVGIDSSRSRRQQC